MRRFQILFSKYAPYVVIFVAAMALMVFGSNKDDSDTRSPIASNFGSQDFVVTSDQLSETYTVATIASTLDLPSMPVINENYATINNIYESAGTTTTTTTVIDKPIIIDTSDIDIDKVKSYVVQDGDTFAKIADLLGTNASIDQIRWSNGLKDDAALGKKVGSTIFVPMVDGIVYVAKANDTPEALAEKYVSGTEQIVAYNNLENTQITEGAVLILPGGSLPEKDRPEYVRPVYVPPRVYTAVDSGTRHGLIEVGNYSYWSQQYNATRWQNNPGAFGNCTWFAWYWRRNNMPSEYWLPTGAIGNARSWVSTLGGSYNVGRTPAYGAVMQSTSGYYGHVAVVVGIEPGVSITIQEMNYAGPNGKFNHVYQSTMNWSDALAYNYIYAHK